MQNIITHKQWLKIFPESREYLEKSLLYQEKILDIQQQIYSNQLDINNLLELDSDSKDFLEIQTDIFLGEDIKETEKKIKNIKRYIDDEVINNRISESDIQSARDYPFENLIELKRGFALCPFHQDKNPSFYVKNNWGYCFSCGKSVDTIAFIMETEGLNFIQAVNKLK